MLESLCIADDHGASGEHWQDSARKCWKGEHIVLVVVVLTLLPMFVGLSLIVVATFFDRDPESKNIESKVRGGCDENVL